MKQGTLDSKKWKETLEKEIDLDGGFSGGIEDPREALNRFAESAKKGNRFSQCLMGDNYCRLGK